MTPANPLGHLSRLQLSAVPANHPALVARRFDWSDQADVHRAVMSLFPAVLPGPDGAKRAESTILYRLENPTSGPRILIQSLVPLRASEHDFPTTSLEGLVSTLSPGVALTFRLDVNAVRSQSRSGKRVPVPLAQIPRFLLDEADRDRPGLLRGAVTELQLFETIIDIRRSGATPLRVAAISGIAKVADPGLLSALIVKGIGRGKSYGCGLLTVAPRLS